MKNFVIATKKLYQTRRWRSRRLLLLLSICCCCCYRFFGLRYLVRVCFRWIERWHDVNDLARPHREAFPRPDLMVCTQCEWTDREGGGETEREGEGHWTDKIRSDNVLKQLRHFRKVRDNQFWTKSCGIMTRKIDANMNMGEKRGDKKSSKKCSKNWAAKNEVIFIFCFHLVQERKVGQVIMLQRSSTEQSSLSLGFAVEATAF